MLEDTLLALRLPAFEGRLRVRQHRHPKFYFSDPGLVRCYRGLLARPLGDEKGALLEGYVAMLLHAYRDAQHVCEALYYWSAHGSQVEVAFSLGRADEWLAIEVKSGSEPRPSWFKGLRAIQALPKVRRRIVVYLGDTPLTTEDGIDILPFADFAEALHHGHLWP